MVIKKATDTTKKCHKKNLKFQDWKYCLEATQLLKINQLEKNKLDIDGLNITVTGKI